MTDLPQLFVHPYRPELRPLDWSTMPPTACRQLEEHGWKRVDRSEYEARVDQWEEAFGKDGAA